jgi:hypothetical protein
MEMLTVKTRNPDDVALWSKRISDCKNSGMSPGEWCAENGLNVKTYYYWHNKIRKLVSQQTEFFEVPAAPGRRDVPSATIRVGIVEADIYSGADAEMIRAICKALKTC